MPNSYLINELKKEPMLNVIATCSCNNGGNQPIITFTVRYGRIYDSTNTDIGTTLAELLSIYQKANNEGENGKLTINNPTSGKKMIIEYKNGATYVHRQK